jgi:hypothetical protein
VVVNILPEPWIERVIRKAQDEGKLDVTGSAGRPIPGLARPYDPAWWARKWMTAERARALSTEAARSIEHALPRVLARETLPEIRQGLETLNASIEQHNGCNPDHSLPLLDVGQLIARRATRRHV